MKTDRFAFSHIPGFSWLRPKSTCAVIGILLGVTGSSYGLPPSITANKAHGAEVQATYMGDSRAVGALHSSSVQPLSLATDDLNNDGAPDLLVGYSADGHGVIAVYMGNIDAFAPSSPDVYQAIQAGRMPASFDPAVRLIDLPEAADFIVIGDFNRDGNKDILAAAHGGGLYLLPGNGRGDFGAAQAISLPGEVTALATGEFNKADGAADVAVGITSQDGPAILIFDGASGGLTGHPMKYSLSAEATALAFDTLDNDEFLDLAVAAGDEVIILHGQDQTVNKGFGSRAEHINVGFNVRSLALGSFIWNRDNKRSMALLAEDGTVHLLQRSDLDTRPFTAEEAAALKRNATHRWQSGTKRVRWFLAKQLDAGLRAIAGNSASQLLVTSQISPREVNDLLIVDQASRKINIVRPADEHVLQNTASLGAPSQADLAPISVDVEGEPTAVLAMPKKVNGERDLIVLRTGQAAPISVINASPTTIMVNRTDDIHVSTCAGGANDCSLRGAIDFANANPGTTIIVPAGTYQLTIPATLEHSNVNGDLDVNETGTTIVGAGAATTIIQQTVVDRVMDINFTSAANFTFSISGVTITGGHDQSGLGGGGFLTGGSANSYTVTNCIFDSNAVTGMATNTPGGAISLKVGGSLNVTGSTFTNNNAGTSRGGAISMFPTADTNTSFVVTNSTFSNNQASGEGGAITDQLNGGASPISATISGSTFMGNTVVSGGASSTGGGALDIGIGSGTTTVMQSTFAGNQDTDAAGHGGAISFTTGIVTAHFNRFVNNTTATAPNGNTVFTLAGSGDFTDNWWANITGPNTNDAATESGILTTTPSLTLTVTPGSVSIPASGSTGLTAGFLTDTLGGSIAAANLTAMTGLPVTFGATGGNISGADANIQSSGTAAATFTSTVTGTDNATATVDGVTATTSIQAGVTGMPPSISKLFLPDTVRVNGTSLLSFTIANPNSDTNVTLTGIQFTDALPAGMVVASPNQLNSDCGGTVTAVPGSSSISLSGGIVAPVVALLPARLSLLSIAPRQRASMPVLSQSLSAATGACFISVAVQATTIGVLNNTTGPISAFESGPGGTSNTASLTVNAAPIVLPPTLSKAFGDTSVPLNGTTSLSFTVGNPNSTTELVNVSFNDMLPSGLVVASPNNLTGSCVTSGAAIAANPASNNISLTALALLGSSNCSLSVDVVGTSSGAKNNTTSNITATFDDGSGTFVAITGGAASASMVVVVPPSISKSFNPNVIAPNVPSILTFTITNPAINPVAESGVAFSDPMPAGLTVANSSATVCGGTLTTTAPTGIALSGASIAANSQCVFNVTFTAAAPGNYTNITGAVSSANGGTGNTATAILSVKNADLSITKTHSGDFSRRSTGTYTITVSDSASAGPTNGTVTVIDTLPDVEHTLVPVALTGTGWTCDLGTLTCTRNDSLPPGGVWPAITLTVDVPQNIRANVINSATVSGGGDPNSHTANDPTHIGPPDNDRGKGKGKDRNRWRRK